MERCEADARVELLLGQIEALEQQVAERDERLRGLLLQLQLKDFELARLRTTLFGNKSERVVPEALTLPGLELGVAPASPEPPGPAKRRRDNGPSRKGKRRPALQLDPSCVDDCPQPEYPEQRVCRCGLHLVVLGHEDRIVIERIPARYRRTTIRRFKMVCPGGCPGVSIAPALDPPSCGPGPVGDSLAVDIAVQHYADHLPFHRLAVIFKREGLLIDRSTLSRCAARVATLLAPVVDCMEREVLERDAVVGIDGTGVKVLASPHCQRRTIYVLHAAGHVVYRALESANAESVLEGFEQFPGLVLADAAKVHVGSRSKELGLEVALCNAHARRYFFEARATDAERCEHVLLFYRKVALHERLWATLSPEDRRERREVVLAPLFAELRTWATTELLQPQVLPRSPIFGALAYLLGHWEGLTRFLHDGRIPWTNNESERLLRHVVVGRKAWVFRGSFEGVQDGCVLWSLMQSCRQHGLDPRRYLLDTLAALAETPHSQLSTLTPRAYAERQRAAAEVAADVA